MVKLCHVYVALGLFVKLVIVDAILMFNNNFICLKYFMHPYFVVWHKSASVFVQKVKINCKLGCKNAVNISKGKFV